MSTALLPEAIFTLGFTDLVSVIPPGATLTPSSKIPQSAVGKVPGRRLASGLWAGYDWRRHQPTIEDVRRWAADGASVGLRAGRFPGLDIDCLDEDLASLVAHTARVHLGEAPERIGRPPKRLLVYRTEEPFARMRLWVEQNGVSSLVEFLGQGQQYLIHGIHPGTLQPYTWPVRDLSCGAAALPAVTREQVSTFFDTLEQYLDMLDMGKVTREGDGRITTRATAPAQADLLAPSIDVLRAAMEKIPNTNELFPDREKDYLKMGYAIRAACGDDVEAGFEIWAAWAAKWDGNDRHAGNDPEVVRADWRRMRAPFVVGWPWIAETARAYGYQTATLEFEAVEPPAERPTPEEIDAGPIMHSDQWLAKRVVSARRGDLRYVPQTGKFLVWDGAKWLPDAELLAEDVIKTELAKIGDEVARQGATAKEQRESVAEAKTICSNYKLNAVTALVKSDRSIAVNMASLDHDPWLLNTPAGVVDLRTGNMHAPNPDMLCTRSTSVPPAFDAPCPVWSMFLLEATGANQDLVSYLRRLCGYALTGDTREQQFTFIWGDGGHGKGTFLRVLMEILADYAQDAAMATFIDSAQERHSTDIAKLVGARLVTSSETSAGKRWNEALIKQLTGGDKVTARFMRQDNFTYRPQFKLLFVGNHKPELRNVDAAMRRRAHIVPFEVAPAVKDTALEFKLRAEYSAILAWMIGGCLEWQQEGLCPPDKVLTSTAAYIEDNDNLGRWLSEACAVEPEATALTQDLFASWVEWCNARRERSGNVRSFVGDLETRGFQRWRDMDGKRGFKGLRVLDRQRLTVM